MKKKTVVVVLGNRLNDDGTITDLQKDRLEMAIELEELIKPEYFILSGGVANPKALKSEAQAMYDYLVEKGINKDKLLLEDKSHSTVENALYSVPMVVKLDADVLIVCSSPYHFENPAYKLMESFVKETVNTNLILMTYTR